MNIEHRTEQSSKDLMKTAAQLHKKYKIDKENSIEDKIGQNTLNNEEKQSKDICDVEIKSTANHILPHDNVILDDEKEPMPKRTKQT